MNIEDQLISDFIYEQPQVAVKILKKFGYKIKGKITLPSINKAMFNAVYNDPKKEFINALESAIINEGYSNFEPVSLIVATGMSIISALNAKKQAEKQLNLQKKIALANLSQQKILAEEQIRTTAETDRINILLTTLQQYQSDLQSESTKRIKDSYLYAGMLGASIAVIYGTVKLLN